MRSDWADAQSDLSLHWVHRSFCWFCHAAAHMGMSCLEGYLTWPPPFSCRIRIRVDATSAGFIYEKKIPSLLCR